MKKAVLFLDANVLFSAAYREDSGLLKLWKLKSVKLVSSSYAIEEAKRNFDKKDQLERLDHLLKDVENHPYCHESVKLPEGLIIKEKDKPILLAAITSRADYLITGDVRDFGKFYGTKVGGVMIMPPPEYFNLSGLIPRSLLRT